MGGHYLGRHKLRRLQKVESSKPVEEVVKELRQNNARSTNNYREQSLKIHGLICAKCAREFNDKSNHLRTVP